MGLEEGGDVDRGTRMGAQWLRVVAASRLTPTGESPQILFNPT